MKLNLKNIIICMLIAIIIILPIVMCQENNKNKTQEENNKATVENTDGTDDGVKDESETIVETTVATELPTKPPTEPPTEPETKPEDETIFIPTPTFYLSDYERWVVECLVMGEAGGESYEGQILVAQCILNACIKRGIQPSRVRTDYGYSGWHEKPSKSVKNAVTAVFDHGYKITNEPILYFYAPKSSSGKWHETQRFVMEVGGHRFFAGWDN